MCALADVVSCVAANAVADLHTVTAEHSLEGVVAKRLDSPWAEGRRSAAWVKLKHRRRDTFVVTGWRTLEGRGDVYLLARRGADGALFPAGSVGMGLDAERRAALTDVLVANGLPPRRSRRRLGSVRWAAAVDEVGRGGVWSRDWPVRDAVPRDVVSLGV